ncbi:protein of unknown function [Aquiflexum balticum DSM 16537]|uniref:DUF1788 domain-containing protein n=1 Tax=Aquiflexum balticum DSM 16537 TaxID=758820 RepID=A0A1W2H7H1_9BACT|nr:BREX protein BrxB domain-containing protein [Aquiflexum balticum]SMD44860.1 protein of unknown function [Aquiflexum balticum DSM 16537]
MIAKIDQLIQEFDKVVNEPFNATLSGQERIWFLVYDPAEQRKVSLRMGEFETSTLRAGKKWQAISLKDCFPEWMSNHDYRDAYFTNPEYIVDQLEAEFIPFAIQFLKKKLESIEQDSDTLIAILDVSSLFGFARLSEILKNCDRDFKGRLLIFFPGEFENNQYRLLDARDGWDYLARPITI